MQMHRDYSIGGRRPGDPTLDACVCGGIRHLHAGRPFGCDDCEDCEEFVLADENGMPVEGRELIHIRRLRDIDKSFAQLIGEVELAREAARGRV